MIVRSVSSLSFIHSYIHTRIPPFCFSTQVQAFFPLQLIYCGSLLVSPPQNSSDPFNAVFNLYHWVLNHPFAICYCFIVFSLFCLSQKALFLPSYHPPPTTSMSCRKASSSLFLLQCSLLTTLVYTVSPLIFPSFPFSELILYILPPSVVLHSSVFIEGD